MKWKNIIGFEKQYSISKSGIIVNKDTLEIKSHVKDSNTGYFKVQLWKSGKMKCFFVHRLIAIHFIDNPNNYRCVNHKNGIKTDNRIENLEWCSDKQNIRHSIDVLGKNKFSDRPNFKGAVHLEYGIFCTAQEAANISGVSKRQMLRYLNGVKENKTKFVWS